MNKAIFLDRDSTLIEDNGHVHLVKDLHFLEGVFEGLRKLQDAKYNLIIIANQAGIGKGLYSEKDYFVFRNEMHSQLRHNHIQIDAEYFCPHHPDAIIEQYKQFCECRKPKSGMLLQAANDLEINLNQSWIIGDKESDVLAGKNVGCKAILISKKRIETISDKRVDTFSDAVAYILNR